MKGGDVKTISGESKLISFMRPPFMKGTIEKFLNRVD